MSIVQIQAPASEPVTVAQLMLQMGFGTVSDGDLQNTLNAQLSTYLLAARKVCENYCRRAFITQRWLYATGGFPQRVFKLPMPPLQSIDWFKYVDTSGVVQTLTRDVSYGVSPVGPYGYQLNQGSETEPASVGPTWALPWPPTRMVPSSVLIQMRVGYGGPIIATMAQESAVLQLANGITFNPDDAPNLAGDTGTAITVTGAGPVLSGASTPSDLNTFIASVDVNGQATLAIAASTAVANVAGWAGDPVPGEIINAILLLAQWYYEQGSIGSDDVPEHIMCVLKPYRNLIS